MYTNSERSYATTRWPMISNLLPNGRSSLQGKTRVVTNIRMSRIVHVTVSHRSSMDPINFLLPRRCRFAFFAFRGAFLEPLPADCMVGRSISTSRSCNPPLLLTGKIPGPFHAVANTASATLLMRARLRHSASDLQDLPSPEDRPTNKTVERKLGL